MPCLRRCVGALLLSAATESAYPALQAAAGPWARCPPGCAPGASRRAAVAAHEDALRALGAEPWSATGCPPPPAAGTAPGPGYDAVT